MSAFFLRGKGSVKFLTTIAGNAPTAAEMAAGVDLGKAITAVSGFTTQLNRVSTPILDYAVEVQSDGPQTFVDSSVTIVSDDGTGSDADSVAYAAAATALVDGATGYFVFCPTAKGTIAAGKKVWIFPARVGAANPAWTLDAALFTTVVDVVLTSAARKGLAVLA